MVMVVKLVIGELPIDQRVTDYSELHFTSYCNVFDIMVGLIFYNTPDLEDSMNLLVELTLKYTDPFEMDNNAYLAMLIASQYGAITDPSIRGSAYNFCYSSSYAQNCSLIIYNFYDEYSSTVSDSYYQLMYGACNDTFTIPYSKWYPKYSRGITLLGTTWQRHHPSLSSKTTMNVLLM